MRGVEEKTPDFGDIAPPTVEHAHPSLERRAALSGLGQVVFAGWGGAQPLARLSKGPSIDLLIGGSCPPRTFGNVPGHLSYHNYRACYYDKRVRPGMLSILHSRGQPHRESSCPDASRAEAESPESV